MSLSILIFLISIFLFYIKLKTKNMAIAEKTKKVTTILNSYLMVAPLIGVVVFTILFSTVLQGRLAERSSHALILLALWIYATSFYVEILKHYNNKVIWGPSAMGSVLSVILAIILTPLDRYCTLLYSDLSEYTFALGFFLFAFFYAGNLLARK